MPEWVEFETENVLAGFARNSARGGEEVELDVEGFYTSDDGPKIFTLLDQIYASTLRRVTALAPEQIKLALVNIVGQRVRVLINPIMHIEVLTKRGAEKGAPVFIDDLADVGEVSFPGCELPTEGSLIFIFRYHWRHGLYFNFREMHGAPSQLLANVGALLGSWFGALLQRERIRMDASVLKNMAVAGWFPFSRFTTPQVAQLYSHFEEGWDPRDVVERIRADIDPQLVSIVDDWASKAAFAPHMDVLREAVELYTQGKYRACALLALPKVEGVLRHLYAGPSDSPRSHELRHELVGRVRANVGGYTALLPEAFVSYLQTFYYASFNLREGDLPPSRNAYLHGVGPDDLLLDPTYALRLFLTLDQIFFCVSRMKEPEVSPASDGGTL